MLNLILICISISETSFLIIIFNSVCACIIMYIGLGNLKWVSILGMNGFYSKSGKKGKENSLGI